MKTKSWINLQAMSDYNYEVYGKTHIGKRRGVNQDTFLLDREMGLFLVADGLGGHQAGDIASFLAVEGIHRNFEISLADMDNFMQDEVYNQDLSPLANTMYIALKRTHQLVRTKGIHAPQYKGMGTTMAAVCLRNNSLVSANVGDSPIFLVQAGRIFPLSMTHTVAGEQAGNSDIKSLDVKYLGMLTRAIGVDKKVEPYICEIPVHKGDTVILCTDGLSKKVSKDEMAEIVQKYGPRKACSVFIELANERGGDDNITVVVLKIEKGKVKNFIKRIISS